MSSCLRRLSLLGPVYVVGMAETVWLALAKNVFKLPAHEGSTGQRLRAQQFPLSMTKSLGTHNLPVMQQALRMRLDRGCNSNNKEIPGQSAADI